MTMTTHLWLEVSRHVVLHRSTLLGICRRSYMVAKVRVKGSKQAVVCDTSKRDLYLGDKAKAQVLG